MPVDPRGRELLPVACTLDAQGGAERLGEWRRLGWAAGLGRDVAPGQVTLRFRDVPEVRAELERLVAAERVCCAFLGWRLAHAEGEARVEITGSDEELAALPLMP